MKAGEIVRMTIFPLVGVLLMFLLQPAIYRSRLIPLNISNLDAWVSNFYVPAASLVFFISLLSTVVWFVMTTTSQANKAKEVENWRLIWWLFGLLPVLSICVAIYLIGAASIDAIASLSATGFFVLDVLFLYWFTTATSTPGSLMFIPPLAFELRSLIGAR